VAEGEAVDFTLIDKARAMDMPSLEVFAFDLINDRCIHDDKASIGENASCQ
jgi:hypothetical protein